MGNMTVDAWGSRARVRGGLSTSRLARLGGVGRTTAWRWVVGEDLPRGVNLVRLARGLRVEPGAILSACLSARADREQRKVVERARLEAESE